MQSRRMYDWNDIRIFVSVARAGSAVGAAKNLGLNQATVNRRIKALERDLGLSLFDRQNRGHSLTEQGQVMLAAAERVAEPANDLLFAAERLRRNISGVVRVTAPEETSNAIIIPITAEFCKLFPEVRVEQVVADQKLDIVHGEADVAVRNGSHPDDPRLIAQRLPGFNWTLFCSKAYVEEHGKPSSLEEVAGHNYVGYAGGPTNWSGYKWFMEIAKPTRIVSRSNTVPNMCAVLRTGLGAGLLPCFVGDSHPDLVRCFPPIEELDAESWMLTSPEALSSPQVRAFVDFLVPRINAQRKRLKGR